MEEVRTILSWILLGTGAFVGLTGALGILRMPDFYTRLHPAGKSDSLAHVLIFMGLLLHARDFTHAAKLILISIFLILTTPAATHAITLAAHLDGLKPWKKTEEAKESP